MIAEPIIKNTNSFIPYEIDNKKEIQETRERILTNKIDRKKTKYKSKENKKESINLNFFVIIIFVVGIVIGSISYRILIEDPIIKEEIIHKFSSNLEADGIEKNIFKESVYKNLKILIMFWIIGISIVGAPIILLLCFYKGFSTAFVIGTFLLKYGFARGNIFVFKYIFPYYFFGILGIVLLTTSSIKVSLNVLKKKKDIRYEIIRHSLIIIFVSLLFLFSSIIEAKIIPNQL